MASTSVDRHQPSRKRKRSLGRDSPDDNAAKGNEVGMLACQQQDPDGESSFVNKKPASESASTSSSLAGISESRLPSKKRKGSHDLSVAAAASAAAAATGKDPPTSISSSSQQSQKRNPQQQQQPQKRKGSNDLSVTFEDEVNAKSKPCQPIGSNSGAPEADFPLPERKFSHDESNSSGTTVKLDEILAVLAEPFSSGGSNATTAAGSSSCPPAAAAAATAVASASATRASPAPAPAVASSSLASSPAAAMPALEHLDALGQRKGESEDPTANQKRSPKNDDDGSSVTTMASSGQRLLLDALMTTNQAGNGLLSSSLGTSGRDRLESWGAMSDLSFPQGAGASDSVPVPSLPAAAALQHGTTPDLAIVPPGTTTGAIPAVASSNQLAGEDLKPSAVPSQIALGRDRLNSLASLSEMSVGNGPIVLDGVDVAGDLQTFVAAAVASVSDQLAELAGAMEDVAGMSDALIPEPSSASKNDVNSDASASAASATLMIGAASLEVAARPRGRASSTSGERSRSGSVSSANNSLVDFKAVEAAVVAAEAASTTGILGLESSAASPADDTDCNTETGEASVASSGQEEKTPDPPSSRVRRQLPLQRSRCGSSSSSCKSDGDDSTVSHVPEPAKREQAPKRKRTRSSVGRFRSSTTPRKVGRPKKQVGTPKKQTPKKQSTTKKRGTRSGTCARSAEYCASQMETPKVSNKTKRLKGVIPDELLSPTDATPSNSAQKQAGQKWESMFDCLLEFVSERRLEETAGLDEKAREAWAWDGNVPTNYKTKDGKALGRWVNNQRSAKSKGALKEDREHRLVNAGLKWSVVVSGAWNAMLEELRIYIEEVTKNGRPWDGNVPTSYQIKTKPNSQFNGEDKNLGRWVNRQRSQFQAGRLRKDRQLALEKMGLKWSMLATTSWDSMYESLLGYVKERNQNGSVWDGNVPANYKTNDNPPRALGRWINRQRSAYAKKKLKLELTEKLNAIGLRWSIHQRPMEGNGIAETDLITTEDVVQAVVSATLAENSECLAHFDAEECSGKGSQLTNGKSDERKGNPVDKADASNHQCHVNETLKVGEVENHTATGNNRDDAADRGTSHETPSHGDKTVPTHENKTVKVEEVENPTAIGNNRADAPGETPTHENKTLKVEGVENTSGTGNNGDAAAGTATRGNKTVKVAEAENPTGTGNNRNGATDGGTSHDGDKTIKVEEVETPTDVGNNRNDAADGGTNHETPAHGDKTLRVGEVENPTAIGNNRDAAADGGTSHETVVGV